MRRAAPILLALLLACGGAARAPEAGAPPAAGASSAPAARRDVPAPPDPIEVYRRLGLIAHGGAFPLTGRVSYLAGPTADTTLAVLTLAMPSRGLSFTHRGSASRA